MAKDNSLYKNARITFSTVEEQSLNNYQHWIGLTPSERISEVTRLIEQVYGQGKKNKVQPQRIIFDNE